MRGMLVCKNPYLKGSICFLSLHHIVHHPLVVAFDIFIHRLHTKQWALAWADGMMDTIRWMMLNQHPKMLHNKHTSIERVSIILNSNSRSNVESYPNETLKCFNSCMRNSIKKHWNVHWNVVCILKLNVHEDGVKHASSIE